MRASLSFCGLLALAYACNEPTTQAGAPRAASPAPTAAAAPARAEGADDAKVVASWEGGSITYGEVRQSMRSQLDQMEASYLQERYSAESQGLQQMMLERMLEQEAKAAGHADVESFLDKVVLKDVPEPTDAEITEYYGVMQRRLRNAPLSEVKELLAQDLKRRKEMEVLQGYAAGLQERLGATGSIPFPDMPRIDVSVDDDPSKGADSAVVTIVQFAEFQCPYCGKSKETVDKVLADYDGKVRMVFRDFPLGFHDRAIPAAVAANCAGDQGKYWEMYDLLMSNQRSLEEADLVRYATQIGVDQDRWQTCRQDPAQQAEVEKDMADGTAAGVSGTPAFFINGIMLSGAQPYEQFKTIIDAELERM